MVSWDVPENVAIAMVLGAAYAGSARAKGLKGMKFWWKGATSALQCS
jgi:hypothetical protein